MSSSTPHSPSSGARTPARAPVAWMDGRVVAASKATVPLTDDGFLRGDAVFETILVRGGRTHAREAHLARLRASAKAVGIRLPVVTGAITDLLAAWGDADGACKIVVTRSGLVRGLLQTTSWPEAVALVSLDLPWGSPLSGVKTISYAINQWALRRARELHGDDALVLQDGVVCEVPTAGIVWRVGDVLHTPDPSAVPILDSITVRMVEKWAATTDHLRLERGTHRLEDVLAADAVWLFSATRAALPVHAIDDTSFDVESAACTEVRDGFGAWVDATLD